jgi:glucosylglycerate phosphorylase
VPDRHTPGYSKITRIVPTFYTTKLVHIYGPILAAQVESRLKGLVERYRGHIPAPAETSLSENDSFLITYAEQVRQSGSPHLQTLDRFCNSYLRGVVNGVHILPFFPWSSDDGFSVMDHRAVDPRLGDWQDVERLSKTFRLMVDGVINHASAQGMWFQAFLRDETPYRDYFITVEGKPDLSRVVRPRALPLLTEFQSTSGKRQVWTTFSTDQVDLDFQNPDVFLEIIDILLMYASRGAQFIRLDAVAYLWKEIGSTCIHLPQTHAIIQLLRAVLDDVAPHVHLITETNVPHSDNISYFGNGYDEAQLVYNFALPPLVLHTFRTGDASILSQWADGLDLPSERTTFFNFLASHDGIGLNPARGILPPADIDALVNQTLAHGGLISLKQNSDGTQSPYELNINYFDALSNPSGGEPPERQVDRFMAAQAIMLSLRGVPGIYFHSLFGSRNWNEGVQTRQYNRAINRQKLDLVNLEDELADQDSLRSQVFQRYCHLLSQRASSAAFHPNGKQRILEAGRGIFAVLRDSPDGLQQVLCLQNVTAQSQTTTLANSRYTLKPYQTQWLNLRRAIPFPG